MRHNFNRGLAMDAICKKDFLRPVLENIYFEDGFAYASNGFILVKNDLRDCSTLSDVDINALNGKLLYSKHYKEMMKYEVLNVEEKGISASRGDVTAFFNFTEGATYPQTESLLSLDKPKSEMRSIAIDMNLLATLSKGMHGSDNCEFHFFGEGRPILVTHLEGKSMGLIMPKRK